MNQAGFIFQKNPKKTSRLPASRGVFFGKKLRTNMKLATRAIAFFALYLLPFALKSQDFMMQAWYWNYPKNGCDGFSGANWAANLTAKVPALDAAGFTMLWTPPASRASFGQCSNGYDPKDLFDLGEFGLGRTGFGTRAEVNALTIALENAGMIPVADVVFNHRDGGRAEHNPAVQNYVTNYPVVSGAAPFPSDRWRCALPIGGATGLAEGIYKFRISSKTGSANFNGKPFKAYINTNLVGWQGLADVTEVEPNGGADCGQTNQTITLGRNITATVETTSGCNTDEFQLTLGAGQFNSGADTLFIYLANQNGDYADQRIYAIKYTPTGGSETEAISGLLYQTYTNFNGLPSQRGGMNYLNFRPNGIFPTTLSNDEEAMYFFYDYEQAQQTTQDTLNAFAKWLLTSGNYGGLRMDAVKHFPPSSVASVLNYLNANGINPPMAVGEHFTVNAGDLRSWANAVEANMTPAALAAIDVRAFDFELRQSLKDACDAFGYDVRNVFTKGMVDGGGSAGDAFRSVVFVNNHDYRDAGQPVWNDPMLAYAYILTNNSIGLPCVFYPEYYGAAVPNYPTVNLKTKIDSLMKIHQDWIFGATGKDYLSRIGTPYYQYFVPNGGSTFGFPNTTLTYQLSGAAAGREVIVAINFAGVPLDYYQEVKQVNGVTQGTPFRNMITGAFTNITNNPTDPEIHIEIPARSYAVYVQQIALPVEWLRVEARQLKTNNSALITWRVGSETGNSHFTIEKSTDGGQNFQPIGTISGRGTATDEKTYSFLDENFTADAHYRIAQTDFDGKTTRSKLVFLKNTRGRTLFQLAPNPVDAGQQLLLTVENGTVAPDKLQLLLTDTVGRTVGTAAGNLFDLNFWLNENFQKQPVGGLFFVEIKWENGGRQVFRLVKN